MDQKTKILDSLEQRTCLKVIAGINNFDKERVLKIAGAANQARASVVDICAGEDIIEAVISKYPELPVMVSSVSPAELRRAIELGTDAIELGNYEALHEQGIFYTADEVLEITDKILHIVNEYQSATGHRVVVSITVPGHLEVREQVELAVALEERGVDVIQTEGAALVNAQGAGALGQIEKARLTLANTIEISKALEGKAKVLTASGITPDTAPLAVAAGSAGIGVGKYVSKLESELEMLAAVTALRESISTKTESLV